MTTPEPDQPAPASEPRPQAKAAERTGTNPFVDGRFSPERVAETAANSPPEPHFPYLPTAVPQQVLRGLPYKTSNRILDDMRYTPALAAARESGSDEFGDLAEIPSLLAARPIAYKNLVLRLAHTEYACLVLNNPVPHAASVVRTEHEKDGVVVTVVRGLIVNRSVSAKAPPVAGHFKVQILATLQSRAHASVDKHQYHAIPREYVSVDDLSLLGDAASGGDAVLDDAFFKSLNAPLNHVMRVTVYAPEFTPADLQPFADPALIKQRYLRYIAAHPDCNLSPDAVPSPVQCFQTLLKVLKGPVLLAPDEVIHTISRKKTHLDAKIDVDLLFRKLAFTAGEDPDSLVPPVLSLAAHQALKESYVRKAAELIFIGKTLRVPLQTNDFDVAFSFSDNLSQVHSVLGEVDKHASLSRSWGDATNRFPDFVALSAYNYFQDELVIRCFENTVNSDPAHKMLYVDNFSQIMALRGHNGPSRLQSYYNNQFLKGQMYGFSHYRDALNVLGVLGLPEDATIAEDTVIEMYKATCKEDPKNFTFFTKQLQTICAIKNSPVIQQFLRDQLVPQPVALQELSVEELTEDEVVITAYEFRADEVMQSVNFNVDSPEIAFLQKCLLSIAVLRKSYLLLSYVNIHMPELLRSPHTFSYSDALALFGIDFSTSDFDTIARFQEKLLQSSYGDEFDVRSLRAALEVIAMERKSEILASFLKSGKIDESLLPAENWPTGLDNIGNTCYLNSLLQYYFSIKPLREFILNFDEKNVDFLKVSTRKIGGRLVEESEGGRSIQFIYRLQELFNEMITTDKRYILPSKELVYLSFLPLSQLVTFGDLEVEMILSDTDMEDLPGNIHLDEMSMLDSSDPFSDNLSKDQVYDTKMSDPDLIQMSSLTSEVGNSAPDVTMSQPENEDQLQAKILKIGSEQIESAIEIGRQQDVTECIENVTFQIETALEPEHLEEDGEQYDLIKRLFSGRTKQTITPLESKAPPRVSFERFFSLIINVSDHPRDIYDALDNYFGESIVNLEEGKVKMSATILQTPEILQFHVQRVLFDRERLMAYKSLEVIPFGENIYLDRYLDTTDADILGRRQEVFEWKTEISKLLEERQAITQIDPATKLSVLDALNATAKYLSVKVLEHEELEIKQETIDAIRHQVELLKIRLQSINTRIENLQQKVSGQFRDYKKFGYSLFAVFIHRGEASYGHYWVYIKDPKRNIYRKYNDDSVTEVPASEVFNFTETNTATPYYMVFVKDELTEDYIEPLKRLIKCDWSRAINVRTSG